MGPHPYPWMVREFQRVIGDEAREQCRALLDGADPDVVVACAGGGSNAAGIFAGFADDTASALVAVEAAGGAAVTTGIPGVLHGMRSALIQDEAGQILEAESISAGLDYPGIGPEHAHLADLGRARYVSAGDEAVLEAFQLLARTEGILPALESAHALAWVVSAAGSGELAPGTTVLVNLSGRGDKDVAQVRDILRAPAVTPASPVARAGHPGVDPAGPAGRRAQAARPLPDRGSGRRLAARPRGPGRCGADAIEVGIPFSDPMIDGTGHPGVVVAGPRTGHDARGGARRPQPGGRRGPAGRHDLLQPDLPGRARPHRRLHAPVGRVGGDHPRPPARGGRVLGRAPPTPRTWPPSCWWHRPPPTTVSARSASGRGASSTPSGAWA